MEGEGAGLGRQARTTPADTGCSGHRPGWEGAQGVSPAGRELLAEGLLAASITEVSLPNALSSPNLLNLILDHTQKLDERWEG